QLPGCREPVELAPYPEADRRAERAQPQRQHRSSRRGAGEPGCGDGLHEGVGDLVAPHERTPQRMFPRPDTADQKPFGRHRARPGTAPAASSTSPLSSAATAGPRAAVSQASVNSTPRPIAKVTATGTSLHVSTIARATFNPREGAKVRRGSADSVARRSRTGGEPTHDEPASALDGAAESTATRPFLGTRRPGAVIPELPRKARLPTLAGPTRSQPPPSS